MCLTAPVNTLKWEAKWALMLCVFRCWLPYLADTRCSAKWCTRGLSKKLSIQGKCPFNVHGSSPNALLCARLSSVLIESAGALRLAGVQQSNILRDNASCAAEPDARKVLVCSSADARKQLFNRDCSNVVPAWCSWECAEEHMTVCHPGYNVYIFV